MNILVHIILYTWQEIIDGLYIPKGKIAGLLGNEHTQL